MNYKVSTRRGSSSNHFYRNNNNSKINKKNMTFDSIDSKVDSNFKSNSKIH